jgi:hypothetical protein
MRYQRSLWDLGFLVRERFARFRLLVPDAGRGSARDATGDSRHRHRLAGKRLGRSFRAPTVVVSGARGHQQGKRNRAEHAAARGWHHRPAHHLVNRSSAGVAYLEVGDHAQGMQTPAMQFGVGGRHTLPHMPQFPCETAISQPSSCVDPDG